MIRERCACCAQALSSYTRIALTSLQSWGSPHAFVVQFLIEPLLTYLFFYCFGIQLSDSSLSVLTAAFVGSAWILALQCSANIVAFDRFNGTMSLLTLLPRRSTALFIWRAIVISSICFLSSLVTTGISLWLTGFEMLSLLPLLVLLLFFATVGGSVFGALGSVVGLFFSDGFAVTNIFLILFPLIGGSVVPLVYFPDMLTKVLHTLPLCWLTDAARSLWSGQILDVILCVWCAVALLILWIAVTILLWEFSVCVQRKTGHIEGMGI